MNKQEQTTKEEVIKYLKRARRSRRGNTQGCGCLLFFIGLVITGASLGIGSPIGVPLMIIGIVVLIVGFFL